MWWWTLFLLYIRSSEIMNGWVYSPPPKFIHEFYLHLEIVDILQHCPVLKTTVRGVEIRIDPDLISLVTDIPLVHPLGIPFPDLDNTPSWEELLAFFDPAGTQVWGPNQTYLPIGCLQSPHRLLARIMLQNIWPISYHSSLTLKRARLLFAILNDVPFCLCKHIIQTMMESLEDN
jgi:hypothetical protein